MANAFVTGSYAYGTPTDKSDIDVVVLADNELSCKLAIYQEDHGKKPGSDYPNASEYFGGMNLIICKTQEDFDLWKEGTDYLKSKAPVSREFAVKYFSQLRKKKGLHRGKGHQAEACNG